MRFATPPSQDRIDAFQAKFKMVGAGVLVLIALVFLTQAALEIVARRGFSMSSGTVNQVIRYDVVFPEGAGRQIRDFFYQNFGAQIEYRYQVGSNSYVGRDTVSNNRAPSKQAVSRSAVKKEDVLPLLISDADPKKSRLPRPLAYPLEVGIPLFLLGAFLFSMRNDKTPPYYMQNVEQ